MLFGNEWLHLPRLNTVSKYLVVVAGPTAVGKTALAIKLAKHYKTVILSADSRQFYKQLSIGTAKPSEKELGEVKHYFINNKNIDELFGAGHFAKEADQLLSELFKTKDLIIVVGGSGLYINALLNGVDEFEEVPPEIRKTIIEEFNSKGLDWLQNEIKMVDPDYFQSVDIQNSQRLMRALEVFKFSGKPYSGFLQKNKTKKKYNSVKLLINTDRKKLYENINHRVDQMMHNGLLKEVESVLAFKDCNALKTVGYKELFEYIEGKCTLDDAVEKIKQHTRNYAKRQITWFKNQGNFVSFEPGDLEKIYSFIDLTIQHE